MESKEYFEKIMQDFNQHRNGRSLRKYCKDEAIDYDWVIEFKKTYPGNVAKQANTPKEEGFLSLQLTEEKKQAPTWAVESLILKTPFGDTVEIKSSNIFVVADLLQKMA